MGPSRNAFFLKNTSSLEASSYPLPFGKIPLLFLSQKALLIVKKIVQGGLHLSLYPCRMSHFNPFSPLTKSPFLPKKSLPKSPKSPISPLNPTHTPCLVYFPRFSSIFTPFLPQNYIKLGQKSHILHISGLASYGSAQ